MKDYLYNYSVQLFVIVTAIAITNTHCAEQSLSSGNNCCFDEPIDRSLATNLSIFYPFYSDSEVPVDTSIEFGFDRDSVGYVSFDSFMQRVNAQVFIYSETGTQVEYAADVVSFDRLILKPLNPLEFDTKYNIIISNNDGNSNTISFTTKSKVFKGPAIRGILYDTDKNRIDIYFKQAINFQKTKDLCLQTANEEYCIGQTQVKDDPNGQFYIDIPRGKKLTPNDNLRITETVTYDGTTYQLQPNAAIESTQGNGFVNISIGSLDECFDGIFCKGDVF